MSLGLQSRRLAAGASTRQSLSFLVPSFQKRTFFGQSKGATPRTSTSNSGKPSNPLTEEYLTRKPKSLPGLVRGNLAKSSVFEDEEIGGPQPVALNENRHGHHVPNPDAMAAALDPRPKARIRWERKMTIREVHKRGRLTRTQLIKRQERELQSHSHNIKTSVKKLGPLARQIAGKTVEEAILQMRFSKKKAAAEVRRHLEHAKNEAIVKRGMGLGGADGNKLEKPVVVMTNAGKRVKIRDPTEMYVDQAWVGKGSHGFSPDYRARGQVFRMVNPTTHLAVVFKEQATRLRIHAEKEEKFKNRKVWVALPNRPITSQRQYYSW